MGVDVKVSRMHRINNGRSLRAFCDVVLGEAFVVKGVKVVDGSKGTFVSMPRTQGKDGKWYDNFAPLTPEAKATLSEAVLAAYDQGE